MEELKKSLESLVNNKEIISIIEKINTSYRTLSFHEKKKLILRFNNIIKDVIGAYLDLHINYEAEDGITYSDVVPNDFNEGLCLNGLNKNPYIYLKDLLFYHLCAVNEINYDLISIGDITYNGDYTNRHPYIASYSSDNIVIKELVKDALEKLLVNADKKYKKEYDKHIDNNLTRSMKAEFIRANEILDQYTRMDIYEPLSKLNDLIEKTLSKDKVSDKYLLAMYAVDNILRGSLRTNMKENDNVRDNLNAFIDAFFEEFKDHLKIDIKGTSVKINNVRYTSDSMFIDELFKAIENIDKQQNIIENVVSDTMHKEYQDKLNKTLSKLEVYFYYKLENLDKYLENRDLEIVNYARFTDIYKFEDDIDIYIDNNRVFNDIFDDEIFIGMIDEFLGRKKGNESILYSIVDMMNAYYYDADFKLVLNNNYDINYTMGSSSEDTIYLNTQNCGSNVDLLETLFHEYRHLMQSREIEKNNGIYNDTLYSYVKLNYSDSPYKYNYAYATRGEPGYQNDILYDLQPIEFDAENFAKYMLVNIAKRSSRLVKVDDSSFNEMYSRKYKFFSNKKISLKYYDHYYKYNKIGEMIESETKEYYELISVFKDLEGVNLYELFLKNNFDSLDWCYKKEFYKKILISKNALVQKDEKHIRINNKEYNLDEIDDYTILEEVLISNGYELAKRGKISLSAINAYVYKEATKYRLNIKDLNEYNLFRVYAWYSIFEKYNERPKKEKAKSKTKAKSR